MKTPKMFRSHPKLDKLPEGSVVKFTSDELYGGRWHKKENGNGAFDPMAFPAKSLIHYHNGREFQVWREGY